MPNIDLDAAKRARAEVAEDEDNSFTFGGQTFALPRELPYEVLDPLSALATNDRDLGALTEALRRMIGDEEHDRFLALKPSFQDVNELLGNLFTAYGLGGVPGEEASPNGDGPGKG